MIEQTANLPEAWTEETDVVVIGAGAAGLTTAVVAATGGASTIVLEKGELIGGTTAKGGGGAWFPANRHMSEMGIEDSEAEALEYLRRCAGASAEDDILVALVENGARAVEFLEDRAGVELRPWPAVGGTIDYRPWLPGAKTGARTLDAGKFRVADLGDWAPRIRLGVSSVWLSDKLDYYRNRMHTAAPVPGQPSRTRPHQLDADETPTDIEFFASGTALIARLLKAALEQGADVYTEAGAEELIVQDGRVIGVRATRDGQPFLVRARRGVVMTTGGFGQSEELKRQWLTRPLEHSCEPETITGDGHLMGAAVGGQLAHMDAWWMPKLKIGDEPQVSREERVLPHSLLVNRAGKRFVNEALNYHDVSEAFGIKEGGWERNLPAWIIFDSQAREKYVLYDSRVPDGEPPEWLTVGDSLGDLAAQLGIDPEGLTATVERFNGFARTGHDLDFGRGENPWDEAWGDPNNGPNRSLGTVEKGPFYAIEVISGALATKGGLRVNAAGEVLSAARPFAPIPGLYAAGNCSSAGPTVSYPGPGSTVGAAMTFGYIIGRQLGGGDEPAADLSAASSTAA